MLNIKKRNLIKCKETVNDLGYQDFIKCEMYQIESIDEEENICYIISEDGSSVQFEMDEFDLGKYFVV